MIWRISFLFILACAATFSFFAFRPEKTPIGTALSISPERSSAARAFTRELLQYAHRDDRRNFTAHCLNAAAPELPAVYRQLRNFRCAPNSGDELQWHVYSLSENIYRVVLTTAGDGGYECVLRFNPEKNEWKFQTIEEF